MTGRPLRLHPDRLLPADPSTRAIARRLLEQVEPLPIISPHGHCDPRWWADDEPFADPATLLITGDHYVLRMLHSAGVPLDALGRVPLDGGPVADPRRVWRTFAAHYDLFHATPSRLWLDHALSVVLGADVVPDADNADRLFDELSERLAEPAFRPRALFDRFGIEFLATTESPLDDLADHRAIRASGWGGNVVTAFRPDSVVDPDHPEFPANLERLAELSGIATDSWAGYLDALAERRRFFIAHGATSTDHGHPSAATADLSADDAAALFARVRAGEHTPDDAEAFRAQMLTEMVRMSLDDGLVVQLHPGSCRNHDRPGAARFGPDIGADIPTRTDYVAALRPLLERFGHEPGLTLVVFTLDETTYSRELAPLAGYYPILALGAPWWFHDSPEGMRRFRTGTTGTAGFANTAGFTDDTRALLSIPARHDVARRVDCAHLAGLVAEHRLDEDVAARIAVELTYDRPRSVYRVDRSRFSAR